MSHDIDADHLDYYLDEFTFRFNRRRSQARGLLFFRLLQQAVQHEPVPYKGLVGGHRTRRQASTTAPNHRPPRTPRISEFCRIRRSRP